MLASATPTGAAKDYVSFKLDPQPVPEPAAAAAAFEIFVYAPLCRGRASARRQGRARRPALVRPARGFSHRGAGPDEGADGQERRDRAGRCQGRLRRQAAAAGGDRAALLAEGIRCYKTFLRGLLDITDNLRRRAASSRRRDVVRYDADDPYLVVAADKGTATFSDIANGVAASTASGSATPSPRAARPATTTRRWASPPRAPGNRSSAISASSASTPRRRTFTRRRHRRHVGRRVRQRHAAVASRSGCVAAFDHRHIFLDPDPDPARSFAERQRLFDLPRSRWDDYDRALISTGGGIWPRSGEVDRAHARGARALLGIEAESADARTS